ncbi:MAG TPA: transcription factor S [Candidatus Aenigmarchaeota archaeon]|nr:transcription factor S [Candidatus Aenigmarchaeota archaeon]
MDFCPKCGTALVRKKDNNQIVLYCRKCGYTTKEYKPVSISEKMKFSPDSDVIVATKNTETLPRIKTLCPACGNKEAVWWMQQASSEDEEAVIIFFRCTKCGHSWRKV